MFSGHRSKVTQLNTGQRHDDQTGPSWWRHRDQNWSELVLVPDVEMNICLRTFDLLVSMGVIMSHVIFLSNDSTMMFLLQITSPRFPVVVKMGHAHSGMGKVANANLLYRSLLFTSHIGDRPLTDRVLSAGEGR